MSARPSRSGFAPLVAALAAVLATACADANLGNDVGADRAQDGYDDCCDQRRPSSDGDSDGDGVPDATDGCPGDPGKAAAGACGCGLPDDDTDRDGAPDCVDPCALDPGKRTAGVCGCGTADADGDGDGVFDCVDRCPGDVAKTTTAGLCGCGAADTSCAVTLQAEDYTDTVGCEESTRDFGYTGDSFVDFPLTADSWVEWTDIEATEGDYELTFRYANGANDRSVAIEVNGELVDVVELASTVEWYVWGTRSITVRLRDGSNTVRVSAVASYGGPNFDSLEIVAGIATDDCPADPTKSRPGVCGCGVADTYTTAGPPDCL